jgi:aspartyl-tRNA(Asn)/glutamyl-tRNA(Gln) amidotransferase subunit B
MQDGSFRCDANISIRPKGSASFGIRTEVKNMNSFRSVFSALQFEWERQRQVLESGGQVTQETRGWVEERNVTVSQRSKEYAHDYRYFPEPDLPPLSIDGAWVEQIREELPELAAQRRGRLSKQYRIPEYDATLLTNSKALADYFEDTVNLSRTTGGAGGQFAKSVSNLMLGDLTRLMNLHNLAIDEIKVTPDHLAELVGAVQAGDISGTIAKTVLEEVFSSGASPGQIVAEKGYTQISDSAAVEAAVAEALSANPKAVADYLGGKDTATRFLVGQVMKITRGQANPEMVNRLLAEQLEALKDGS